ncbi:MAG: hypothetical protein AAFP20_24930 [Cyanobacteria bacterium J06614_10]
MEKWAQQSRESGLGFGEFRLTYCALLANSKFQSRESGLGLGERATSIISRIPGVFQSRESGLGFGE